MNIIWLLLICTHSLYTAFVDFPLHGKRFFPTRSQSVNAARDLAGYHHETPFACKKWWSSFTVTPEYTHSFRPDQIAEYFFGTPYLQISGSKVTNRGINDILADYFGLGQTFMSSVYLQPVLQNALADFRYHIGYHRYYLHIHAPVVWAESVINIEEEVINDGTDTDFEALYMDVNPVQPPVKSFCQAISQGATYGQVTEPLQFGRFGCKNSTTALSEIQIALGWIFLERDNGWLSINARGSIPTGTRPNSDILFTPIVGNGHHGELGIGFYGKGLLWQKDEDLSISLLLEENFTHLFKDTQCRSFDLCSVYNSCVCPFEEINGFGSCYILTKEFDTSGNYTGKTIPLINRLTLPAAISIDIQVDIAIMFAFDIGNWTFDIGYDGWIRSAERLELLTCLSENKLGLKGIQNVALAMGGVSNITQSKATLHGDNFNDQTLVADANSPIFINTTNIDINSAASSRMLTHKIFTHIQYNWNRYQCNLQPFFGLGFEVEFEGNRPKNLQPNKNSLSQWGLWLKTGVGY